MTFDRNTRGGKRVLGGRRSPVIRYSMVVAVSAALGLGIGTSVVMAQSADTAAQSVLAIVNGDTVHSSDLDILLIQTHRSMNSTARGDFDYERLLTRLVNDRLLAQEAMAVGLDQEPRLLEKLDEMRRTRATRKWISDHFTADNEVPEDSILAQFHQNFGRVQCRVITTKERADAEHVHTALAEGADMDSLAQAVSIDNYRNRGGLRRSKWLVDTEPVLRALSDTLPTGVVSDVFPYRSVFAVARVEEKSPADTAELHLVRAQIETWLLQSRNNARWRGFIDSLRAMNELTDNTSLLEQIRADSAALFTPQFAQGTDDAVVRVGTDITISDAEFRGELSHAAMEAGTTPFADLFAQTYGKLVDAAVLMAAATRDGYDDRPDINDFIQHALDSALVAQYIAETVTPRIRFNHEEFDTYKREHPEEFREPDQVQFDEIVVDSEAVAREIYSRLRDGADFVYLSRQYDARTNVLKSKSDFMDITTLPDAMQAELDSVQVGGCMRPRLTEDGWVILKLKARRLGEELSADKAEVKIRAVMYQQKFNEEMDSVLSILRSRSDIYYNEDAIAKYFGRDS